MAYTSSELGGMAVRLTGSKWMVALALTGGAAAATTACSDATGAGGEPVAYAALTLQPTLPASFTPGVFDLAVDRVRIRLTRPPSDVVIDTLVFFPVSSNELSVHLRVPLAARREQFTAALQLLSASTLLFSGSETVEVDESGSTAPIIPLEYVGPGADVTTIRIAPRDTAIKPTDRFTFTVDAWAGANPVSNFYVNWSTDDPAIAPVDAVGTLSAPDHRSSVLLSVVGPNGVGDSTRIYFAPTVNRLEIVSGDTQTGVAGSALPQPLVIRALAADDLGVPGVRVSFQGLSGGIPTESMVLTDHDGYAQTTVLLGPVAGLQAFEAFAPGLAALGFTAIATVGPPAKLEYIGGNNQIDTVTQTLPTPLIARVTDVTGNPVSGVAVTWDVFTGGGTLDKMSSVTNLSGITFADLTLGSIPGPNGVRVSMTNPTVSLEFQATGIAGPPAMLSILSGDNQVGNAGSNLASPLWVKVTDQWANKLPGVTVRWSEVQGGGLLSAANTTTDALGRASVSYQLPQVPASYNVVADIQGTALTVVFSMQAQAPPDE